MIRRSDRLAEKPRVDYTCPEYRYYKPGKPAKPEEPVFNPCTHLLIITQTLCVLLTCWYMAGLMLPRSPLRMEDLSLED
jgi:hypothetical protein